jgi:hypothetical protein
LDEGTANEIMSKATGTTKRRVEITVEQHRLIVLTGRNCGTDAWCEICEGLVQMVTPEQAGQICHVSSRTVYGWIETQQVHFIETDDGFSLVCLSSLPSTDPAGGAPATTKQPGRRNLIKRFFRRG